MPSHPWRKNQGMARARSSNRRIGPTLVLGLLLLVFLAIGGLALVVPQNSKWRDAALVLWGAVPTAAALWQFAYAHLERHRLRANRWWFWVTNPESRWGLVAEFDVLDPIVSLKDANDALAPLKSTANRMLSEATDLVVWQVEGLTLRIAADTAHDPIGGQQGILRVDFPVTHRSFRSWRRIIDTTVAGVLARVEQTVSASDRKFVATVGFPGVNPYFGLFVRSVDSVAVTRFEIDYFEVMASERDLVRVRDDRMELVTSSLHAARQLSLHYLALRPSGGK